MLLTINQFLGSRLTQHKFALFLDSNRNGCGISAVNWLIAYHYAFDTPTGFFCKMVSIDEKHKKFPRNGRSIGLELGPVPTLSKSKMAGQLIRYNDNCIIPMQSIVWVIFFNKATKAFCFPAHLTVDGWFHFFSTKGLGKSEVVRGNLGPAH